MKALFDELLLHVDFPHHRPQNGARRSTINLTMYSDVRQVGLISPRPVVVESRPRSPTGCIGAAYPLRPAKGRSVRYETSWKDYTRALADAKRVAAAGGLDIRRRLALDGVVYDLMPISHLRPGMEVVVERDGRFMPADRRIDGRGGRTVVPCTTSR